MPCIVTEENGTLLKSLSHSHTHKRINSASSVTCEYEMIKSSGQSLREPVDSLKEQKKASEKNKKGKNVNLLSVSVFFLYNGLVRWSNQLECTTMSDYQHVRSSGHFDCI